MTIKELDDKLNSPGFQDTENGDLFYNFFIYQYPAEKEYDIRKQIQEFKANLIRPTNYVDVLTLNLFDEFCSFLDQKKFLRHPSMLKYLMEKEHTGYACPQCPFIRIRSIYTSTYHRSYHNQRPISSSLRFYVWYRQYVSLSEGQ